MRKKMNFKEDILAGVQAFKEIQNDYSNKYADSIEKYSQIILDCIAEDIEKLKHKKFLKERVFKYKDRGPNPQKIELATSVDVPERGFKRYNLLLVSGVVSITNPEREKAILDFYEDLLSDRIATRHFWEYFVKLAKKNGLYDINLDRVTFADYTETHLKYAIYLKVNETIYNEFEEYLNIDIFKRNRKII